MTNKELLSNINATSDKHYSPLVLMIAAFGVYFCMYGFRKPFTAASYSELDIFGIDYKSVLVTSQIVGYLLSKAIGVKVISEMEPQRRISTLLVLVGLALASLLLLAVVPLPWNIVFIFINGLSLGMVFGLVLGAVEGRRQTEILAAGLCASFIVADGASKSIGSMLLKAGVPDLWMPFAAGLLFTPPFLLFTWLLSRIPPPGADDIAKRSARPPMTRADRRLLLSNHAFGLTTIIGCYVLLTVLRSIRADFAPEIWRGLGLTGEPAIFTRSEIFVAAGVLLVSSLVVLIRDNRLAFFTSIGISFSGFTLAGAGLVVWQGGHIGGFLLMVLIGLGLYLPYVAVHTSIFERLIAMTGERGNIGYLMYIADSFGYLGYAIVMTGRNFLQSEGNFIQFFLNVTQYVIISAAILLLAGWIFFSRQQAYRQRVIVDET